MRMRMRGEGMNEGRVDGSCYLCLSWELGTLFKFQIFYQCAGISMSAERNNTSQVYSEPQIWRLHNEISATKP